MTGTELGCAVRLYSRMTIDALPDNVLLETFEFYLDKDDVVKIDRYQNYDRWITLVHVCRRWRCIVFASPCRLDLKVCCTQQRSVNSNTLGIWPALPIVLFAREMQSEEDVTNLIAALRQPNRVCEIYYYDRKFQGSFLKEFAAIDEPFLALTSLKLFSFGQNVPVLPNSFLGGSAPCLRSLHLDGIPYPSMGKLLSSTTNLVRLSLWHIPHSGYISPEAIVPCLSMLVKLKSLSLGFRYPRSRAHRARRHPPPLTHVVLPNLTFLYFRGDIKYFEDILYQIETPNLNESRFCFFNQLVFHTPPLGHFICRTKKFSTIHRACIEFFRWAVKLTLLGQQGMANNDVEALRLQISCRPLDWQLSAVAEVLNSFSSSLLTLDGLEIGVYHEGWQDAIEIAEWQEFLHPFTSVKQITLKTEASVQFVVPVLQELAGERATEVLPALQNLSLGGYRSQQWGPVKEAIEQFIAARQLFGHPVTVYHKSRGEEYLRWQVSYR